MLFVYDHDTGELPDLNPTYHHKSLGSHGGTHVFYQGLNTNLTKNTIKIPTGTGEIITRGLIFVRKTAEQDNLLNLINALKDPDNFAHYSQLYQDLNLTDADLITVNRPTTKPINNGTIPTNHFELYPYLAKTGVPRPVIEQILAHFGFYAFDDIDWTQNNYHTVRCWNPDHEDANPSMIFNVIPLTDDPTRYRIHVHCCSTNCNQDDLLDELYAVIKKYAKHYRLNYDTTRFSVFLLNLIDYLDRNTNTAIHLGTLRSYHNLVAEFSPRTRNFIESVVQDFNLISWEIKHKTYYLANLNGPIQKENLLMSNQVTDTKLIATVLNLEDLGQFDTWDGNLNTTPDNALKLANLILETDSRKSETNLEQQGTFDFSTLSGNSFDFSEILYEPRKVDNIPVCPDSSLLTKYYIINILNSSSRYYTDRYWCSNSETQQNNPLNVIPNQYLTYQNRIRKLRR